jgi:predicted ester cyclase
MPLILTETTNIVVAEPIISKPLRQSIAAYQAVSEQKSAEKVVRTIRDQVVHVKSKKATSSYRQDLLTLQK